MKTYSEKPCAAHGSFLTDNTKEDTVTEDLVINSILSNSYIRIATGRSIQFFSSSKPVAYMRAIRSLAGIKTEDQSCSVTLTRAGDLGRRNEVESQ